jgi:hypothetical protein
MLRGCSAPANGAAEAAMRLAGVFILLTLTSWGCSGDGSQPLPLPQRVPSPTAPPLASAALYGIVLDEGGACIEGAVVHVVGGQRAGESVEHEWRCNYWDFGGFRIRDLIPGVEMTLRATAPGHAAKEETVVPWTPNHEIYFVLEPLRNDGQTSINSLR